MQRFQNDQSPDVFAGSFEGIWILNPTCDEWRDAHMSCSQITWQYLSLANHLKASESNSMDSEKMKGDKLLIRQLVTA